MMSISPTRRAGGLKSSRISGVVRNHRERTAGERAPRESARRASGSRRRALEPAASPPAARLGRLDPGRLGVSRRARRLRLRPGRRVRGRARRPDPALPGAFVAPFSASFVDRFPASRSWSSRTSCDRAHARRGRARHRDGRACAVVYRLVALTSVNGHGLPSRAGRPAAVARRLTCRADGGERRVQHARERRHVPRAGARRPAARRDDPAVVFAANGAHVPLVGRSRPRAPAPRRAAPSPRERDGEGESSGVMAGIGRSSGSRPCARSSACTAHRRSSPER